MTDISTTWAEVIFFNHYEVTNSDDNLCSGCQNLYQQQSFSGLHPPKNQTTPSHVTPQFKPFAIMANKLLKKKLSSNQSHYYVFLVFHQVPDNPQMPEKKKMRIFVNYNANYYFLWEQPSMWVSVYLENEFMSSCYCRLWDEVTKPSCW